MKDHPNRFCFVNYIITGFVQDFLACLSFLPKESHLCNNLKSALTEPETVDKLLANEVEKGYMVGPHDNSSLFIFHINPARIATQLLLARHDDSASSINSLTPLAPLSLCYATVYNAIQFIKLARKGTWLGKADVTDPFKVMQLHPSQWHLFEIKW